MIKLKTMLIILSICLILIFLLGKTTKANDIYIYRSQILIDSGKIGSKGLFQAIQINKNEILLVYFVQNIAKDYYLSDDYYKHIYSEIDPNVSRDNNFRMSVWKYLVNEKRFVPVSNYRYPYNNVYCFNENGKFLATISRENETLIISNNQKILYKEDLSKYLQFHKYTSSYKVDREKNIYEGRPIVLSLIPVYVSEKSVLLWTELSKGGVGYVPNLISINPQNREFKVYELENKKYNLDWFCGISRNNTCFFLWNNWEVLKFSENGFSKIYHLEKTTGILLDFYKIGDLYYIHKQLNKSKKKVLSVYNKAKGTENVIESDVTTVYQRDKYLIIFKFTDNQQILIVYNTVNKKKKKFKLFSKHNFFPVLSLNKKQLLLFYNNERKEPKVFAIE